MNTKPCEGCGGHSRTYIEDTLSGHPMRVCYDCADHFLDSKRYQTPGRIRESTVLHWREWKQLHKIAEELEAITEGNEQIPSWRTLLRLIAQGEFMVIPSEGPIAHGSLTVERAGHGDA